MNSLPSFYFCLRFPSIPKVYAYLSREPQITTKTIRKKSPKFSHTYRHPGRWCESSVGKIGLLYIHLVLCEYQAFILIKVFGHEIPEGHVPFLPEDNRKSCSRNTRLFLLFKLLISLLVQRFPSLQHSFNNVYE